MISTDVIVTQADREAAAALAHNLPESFGGNDEAAMRHGIWDDGALGDIVQAFAAHRIASQAGLVGLDLNAGEMRRLFAMFSKAADFSTERDQRIHDVLRAAIASVRP